MLKRVADELRDKEYERFYITKEGLKNLREKLARLKLALPERAEEARRTAAYGDRSENDEYKTAKAALRRTKWQILSIEDQIKRAAIIKSGPAASGKIRIGSTVVLEINGERKTFQILGPHETDPARGRISHESPLGAALLNHKKGGEVVVHPPTGRGRDSQKYLVFEIR